MPALYPPPVFRFTVQWGRARVGFAEVTGLTQKPGLRKLSNITLKRGVVARDNDFFAWLSAVKPNTVERRDLVISLLNEKHAPVKTWKLQRAFPVKVEGPQLKADANEVAIESIELAHEGLEVQNEP